MKFVIGADDAKQSALFWLLGHFYDYDVDQLASIFGVPGGIMMTWIGELGIDIANVGDDAIYCRVCKGYSETIYCAKCRKKEQEIKLYIRNGYIPLTVSRFLLYDMNNHKVVHKSEVINDLRQSC